MSPPPSADADSTVQPRIRQQEVVAELGQQALETDDLDALMDDASAAITEVLGCEYGAVLELCAGSDEAVLRQGTGWRDGRVKSLPVGTDSSSPSAYTLRTDGAVIVGDLRTEDRFSEPTLLADHDVVSGVCVVVGPTAEPWGVLSAYTVEKREFTTADANFLRSVANVLASTVEHARTSRRFEAVFEDPNILVGLLDPDGTVLDINRTAMEYIDADLEAVRGVPFWKTPWWGAGDAVQSDIERWTERAADGEYVEFETDLTRPSGEGYTLSGFFRPVTDGDGNVVSIIVSDRDVTERKQHEQELELFRNLLDYSNDSVFVLEPETGRVLDVNATARRRTGYSRAELLERSVPDLEEKIPDGDAWRSLAEEVRSDGSTTFDGIRRRKDGSTFPVEVNLSVAELDREYVLAMVRDVTERRKHERKLEDSNERLEQFAYAASHDLQEPLRMVTSYLQLLEDRYSDELDDDAEEFIAYAVDGAERMREMIDGLLEYSRIETQGQSFEPIELETIFEDVVEDLQLRIEESEAEITADDLPRVEGDASQLRQVFQNLLGNAIEYSGDEPPRIHVEADKKDRLWQLSIHDEGIGIDADDQERVFEIFNRLHSREQHGGTGIGLALCQRVVERHGGEIWVDSEPGAGATFSVTLPPVDGADS